MSWWESCALRMKMNFSFKNLGAYLGTFKNGMSVGRPLLNVSGVATGQTISKPALPSTIP